MRCVVGTPEMFLKGERPWHTGPEPIRHPYRAQLLSRPQTYQEIIVTDEAGQPVAVSYGGSRDNRTLYAYVDGVGFIGGWKYPHRAQPFATLVESINRGVVYRRLQDLPCRLVSRLADPALLDDLTALLQRLDQHPETPLTSRERDAIREAVAIFQANAPR